jgi:5-methylcytosine-specific restriction endonuclease McrA
VDRGEALRVGIQSFCGDDCRTSKQRSYQSTTGPHKRSRMKPKKPKNPMPEALRDAVIASDGGRCRRCRTSDGLHVHHIVYRSQGGGHVAENLITLCYTCHDVVHSNKKKWQPAFLELSAVRQEHGDKHSRLKKFVED